MKKIPNSPCIRCGTERVVSRIWEEKVDDSVIVNTELVCPDVECQKKVNIMNKKSSDKYAAIKSRSDQRAVDRKAALNARKSKKNSQ